VISVSVEDDPPPIVRAVAKDLAAHLEDPSFAEATAGLAGAIAVKDASTPQALTLRLGDGRVSLAHGAAADADLSATVAFEDGSEAEPEFEPDAEHPELARWLAGVLEAPAMSWPEAADRFWSVLERMSGAPEALLVTDLESGEQHRYGAEDGRAYEIKGAPRALIDVLSGRVPLIDAAFGGAVLVRGSFPELSLLTGAGFTVRYGGEGWDG
jgi:hypothetical protein